METLVPNSALELIESTQEEINILNELGEGYKQYSEMSNQDRAFLNTLVLRKQPRKLLEIGVCSGGSSLVLLNAIKNIEGAHLYSIDYNTQHYRLKDKLTGFYVDNFPELKEKWTLKTGGLALNFMEEIGADIDFCLLDTVHSNPGEILDFLMVLPFLKKGATVVLHDVNLQTVVSDMNYVQWQFTNNLLMSAISGKKMIPSITPYPPDMKFFNIGAIELDSQMRNKVFDIFNLLTIRWRYSLNENDISSLTKFFQKFYNEFYSQYFKDVISLQKEHQLLSRNCKNQPNKSEIAKKYSLLEKLFSVKNSFDQKHKVITFLGVKLKIKKEHNNA